MKIYFSLKQLKGSYNKLFNNQHHFKLLVAVNIFNFNFWTGDFIGNLSYCSWTDMSLQFYSSVSCLLHHPGGEYTVNPNVFFCLIPHCFAVLTTLFLSFSSSLSLWCLLFLLFFISWMCFHFPAKIRPRAFDGLFSSHSESQYSSSDPKGELITLR